MNTVMQIHGGSLGAVIIRWLYEGGRGGRRPRVIRSLRFFLFRSGEEGKGSITKLRRARNLLPIAVTAMQLTHARFETPFNDVDAQLNFQSRFIRLILNKNLGNASSRTDEKLQMISRILSRYLVYLYRVRIIVHRRLVVDVDYRTG